MLKKKLVVLNTTILLGLGTSLAIPGINAHAIQPTSITQQQASLKSQISDAQIKIVETQEELKKLEAQIKRVDKAIEENKSLIEETKAKMKATEKEIDSLEKKIKELEDRIEKRNDVLKERARSFQENGGSVDYIEVLFGAASFKEFVDRVGAVATIMEADQDLIASNEKDKEDLETKQNEIKDKYDELNNTKLDLEEMQKQNEDQQKKNEQSKKDLKAKEAENKERKAELEQKYGSLQSVEPQIKKMIQQKEEDNLNQLVASTVGTNDSGSASKTSSEKASGGKSKAITAGYKYIGNSTYKFGGGRTASDVANGLFDCSGFVSWAYSQAGYSIPASTDALKNSGTRVSTSDMQPGDLVFFNTYKTDGHVGIYIGGGKFIGSQSSTGVAIASMNSGYWKSVFNGRVVRF
ncbi:MULTISPECIES: coiled-coil domain-containing protein [Bacillaceae]|uniref:coiled-coil domain-containing protein n=1 Tax=Bacillaceae TaxID=186817 RepID=UPI0004E2456A|nr:MULTISPECIES: C40 family peptidase [Bacillaceae]MCF2647696.1 C40 family peptidase [Niallia circulans]MCM3360598.1 NlpC/P60 family protein [Niallia sp. MER TA 168]